MFLIQSTLLEVPDEMPTQCRVYRHSGADMLPWQCDLETDDRFEAVQRFDELRSSPEQPSVCVVERAALMGNPAVTMTHFVTGS